MNPEYDVLFLYNELEPLVDDIVYELDDSGYATFFWRRDVRGGAQVDVEIDLFDKTATVLVLLGEQGWGVNHLRIAREAITREKHIVPVNSRFGPGPRHTLTHRHNW